MLFDIDFHKTLQAGARRFDLHFTLRSHQQRVVIHGPSGAGKSQTLQAIAGLMQPDSGHIRIAGRTLFDAVAGVNLPPPARHCGYLFQDYALFPHLNVRQNVLFGLQRGWLNPLRRTRLAEVEQCLHTFGLAELAQQLPDQLSGGQRQRVALARAIVARPQWLLLDEPFAALDPALRSSLRQELDTLQRSLQLPMLLISHDCDDVAQFGDHVLQLCDGKVVAADEPGKG